MSFAHSHDILELAEKLAQGLLAFLAITAVMVGLACGWAKLIVRGRR